MTSDPAMHPMRSDVELEIPDEVLRGAIEVAFIVAVAASRNRPPLPVPAGLRPYLKMQKLPDRALAAIRRVVESDEGFRCFVAPAATEDLTGRLGWLWLHRPDGWGEEVVALLADDRARSGQIETERAERSALRRVEAAELAAKAAIAEATTVRAASDQLGAQLERERGRVSDLEALIGRLERRLTQQEVELSGARRRLGDAEAALAFATEELEVQRRRPGLAEDPAREWEAERNLRIEQHDRLRARLGQLEAELDVAVAGGGQRARARRPPSRRRVKLPGGVHSGSRAAIEHLLRTTAAVVLIDGYNLAKGSWPDVELSEQRSRAIELLDGLGARFSRSITVVFDGADVVAPSSRRRWVHVRFSPAGTSADDVLVESVERTAVAVPVVVVTSDGALTARLERLGAHVVTSEALLTVARSS